MGCGQQVRRQRLRRAAPHRTRSGGGDGVGAGVNAKGEQQAPRAERFACVVVFGWACAHTVTHADHADSHAQILNIKSTFTRKCKC
jgi:hypothetical protein